jgi:protein ImuB
MRDQVGARAVRLNLYALDGAVETIDFGLSLPTRSVPHVARLIELKLDALTAMLTALEDTGFGFEAIGLAVTRAEPMPARQIESDIDRDHAARPQQAFTDDDNIERCAGLIDALRQRLGADRVRAFEAVASHIPERAERLTEIDGAFTSLRANGSGPQWPARWQAPRSNPGKIEELDCFVANAPRNDEPTSFAVQQPRPLLLLPQAEPAEVTALVPDGPPRRLRWRGVTYDVAGAQGPERIADEWWRAPSACAAGQPANLSRDYYLVEDATGHRFWLYREGLYSRETAAPRWFVHGLFA